MQSKFDKPSTLGYTNCNGNVADNDKVEWFHTKSIHGIMKINMSQVIDQKNDWQTNRDILYNINTIGQMIYKQPLQLSEE